MSTILCGPIVRRTSTKAVYIWIATEGDEQLGGAIRVRGDNRVISIDGGTKKVQLGQKLVVHLVCIKPENDGLFDTDTILHYDIYRTLADGRQESLLEGDQEIRYPGEAYPGFIIPEKLKNVLHGSCRKPHAGAVKKAWGTTDQLTVGDDLLVDSFNNPVADRPSTLFMTGDQIYADDVSGPLLAHLTKLGRRITGWDEEMPRRRPPVWTNGLKTADDHKPAAKMRLYGRSYELRADWTGITSASKRNHLMSFGEYAAMYLSVWGGPGARVSLPNWQAVQSRVSSTISANHYNKERKLTEAFCKTVGKVRRLLANISVYMIFDDHEVTDDWNINPVWEGAVNRSPRARRVLSNSLAAYWAFQGWGNHPDQFDDAFIQVLQTHLNSRQYESDQADKYDALLWQKKVDRWAYVTPTDPVVVALDTRTCREQGRRANSQAKLMNQAALDWLKAELDRAVSADGKHVCLISAAPVLGLKAVEDLQGFLFVIGGSVAALDMESWNVGLDDLKTTIAATSKQPGSITVLSGDVHYSFMREGEFEHHSGHKIPVFQMTSSPFHNKGMPMTFSDRDRLVQKGGFVVSEEQVLGRSIVISGINNLALARFDDDGKIIEQQLTTTLADNRKHYLSYRA
ncbi:MAG: alkaline phosphatase D family protein [Mariprofundaceae bacterium]